MVKKVLFLIITFTFFLVPITINAETKYETLKVGGQTVYYTRGGEVKIPVTYVADVAEMRGAWVATVWNNDMPKQTSASEKGIQAYKEAFLKVLDTLEKFNMNTVFFQVRPNNDAFYPSEYNDWSQFLVADGVNPGWNPLEWMVEVTHERNMYFQCWMNAFRVTVDELFSKDAINYTEQELLQAKKARIVGLTDNNFAKQHPECVLMGDADSKLILNPADILVQEHLLNTIRELVTNYDIDGFHFDDYFYLNQRSASGIDPQKKNLAFAGGYEYNSNLIGENTLNDIPTYLDYQANPSKYDLEPNLELGNFRRQSLNKLMRNIRNLVDDLNQQLDKHVEFGSKPAAVWQSNYAYCHDPATAVGGSDTACGAYSSNYELFADTKYWVEQGYVDWIAPQVYYDFQNDEVPYADIVKWWANVVTTTNEKRAQNNEKPIKMYVAHGIYKYHASSTEYNDSNEIVYQFRYNKLFPCIKGSAVYAYSDLVIYKNQTHSQGIGAYFYTFTRANQVLPLPKAVFDTDSLEISDPLIRKLDKANFYKINFDKLDDASMYVIFKVKKGDTLNLNNTNQRFNIIKAYPYDDQIYMELNYDNNYEYYIQAVSNNYYPSTKAVKLDMSKAISNRAPLEVTFSGDDKTIGTKDLLTLTVPYAQDLDKDPLTYKFSASINGISGPFNYDLTSVEYLDDCIKCTFQGFGAEFKAFVVKMDISDGLTTTTVYSKPVVFTDATTKPDDQEENNDTTPAKTSCMGAYFISTLSFVTGAFILMLKKRH